MIFNLQKRLRRGPTVAKTKLQRIMIHATVAFEDESGKTSRHRTDDWAESATTSVLNTYFDFRRPRNWVASREELQRPSRISTLSAPVQKSS
jgi:hypothetical protein